MSRIRLLGAGALVSVVIASPVSAQVMEWTKGEREAHLGSPNSEVCVSLTLTDGAYAFGSAFRLELLPSGYFSLVMANADGSVARLGPWMTTESQGGISHVLMVEYTGDGRAAEDVTWMAFLADTQTECLLLRREYFGGSVAPGG